MNKDLQALLNDDACRAAISQAPADVAALLLAGEAGEIITQNDAASELFHLDDGDLLATAFSDEANDLICDCADTGKEQHMTENCFGRLYYLTAVPHEKNVLVVLKPLPNTSKTGAYFACMDTFSRSVTQLHRLLPLVTDPQAAAALTREAGLLQRTAFHLSELLNPPIYGTMRITVCDLSRLCSDAANNVSRRLPEGKRDCIALNVPMQCEAQLDVVRVRAALYNLLTNAVAVSQEPGSVSLTLTVENRPAYDGETIDWAVITVSDCGPGLSADKLESALTAWRTSLMQHEQLQAANGRLYQGMGLAYAQLVAQAHEGEFTCEQRPDGGTAIRFAVPLFEPNIDKGEPSYRDYFFAPLSVEDVELSVME